LENLCKTRHVRLSHSQLKAFSAAALSFSRPVTLAELPDRVFETLRPFLPCDYYAYHEFTKFTPVRNVMLPNYGPDIETFAELIDQHPSIRQIRAQRLESAVKISDFVSLRQFHRTDIHHYLFQPENLNYQLSFITQDPNCQLGLALNRTRRDYTEEERQMLDLIRPHLVQAFHNSRLFSSLSIGLDQENRGSVVATRHGKIRFISQNARDYLQRYAGAVTADLLPELVHGWLQQRLEQPDQSGPNELELHNADGQLTIRSLSSVLDEDQHLVLHERKEDQSFEKLRELGLTRREAEVLFWVSQGKRNAEIGVILSARSRTITKHLERVFQKLSVETRTAAAGIALDYLK
jgi:DNA-binding CsgD family transcriptional regulator